MIVYVTVSTTVYINNFIKERVFMNTIVTKARMKCAEVADKLYNSKAYRCAEKVAVGASTALAGVGLSAMSAFAADLGSIVTSAASADSILENAEPFIEPAIILLCSIGGIRLGMRFLRSSIH